MRNGFQNKRIAQELIEFALIIPILMFIIFIVVDMGNALNSRMAVSEGTKSAMMEVNKFNNLGGNTNLTTAQKTAVIENFVTNKVMQYLIAHNIPNSGSVNAKVSISTTNSTAVVNVYYQYNPFFLVTNVSGQTPTTIPLSSSQTLNYHLFMPNTLPVLASVPKYCYRTTQQLSQYSTNGGGAFVEAGELIGSGAAFNYGDLTFNVREQTVFLLHFYDGVDTFPFLADTLAAAPHPREVARLVSWDGYDLLPPNERININTGTLEVRSPYYNAGAWFDTKVPYIWVVSAMGFTHVIYVKYNTKEMDIEDSAALLYKLHFADPLAIYNCGMNFCTGAACAGDLRGTANINERALRMNPLLGTIAIPDSTRVVGTIEPIVVAPAVVNGAALAFVQGDYFSYTTAYNTWATTNANWNSNFFVSIASPTITTLGTTIYNTNESIGINNPFYNVYRYTIALNQHNQASPGVLNAAIPANNLIQADDGLGATYAVDIVDVYIDSDGDGIPDAWDRDPEYFDVNVNGKTDGNEVIDMNAAVDRCRAGVNVGTGPNPGPVCPLYPDAKTVPPSPVPVIIYEVGVGAPFYVSTPYTPAGALVGHTTKYLPAFAAITFYGESAVNFGLYVDQGLGNYTRKYPTWWTLGLAARRAAKAGYIHGLCAGACTVNDPINLLPSQELQYLSANQFTANNRVTRTAPTVW